MRDAWYFQLPVGWYKLTIAERGFLSTLFSQGESLRAMFSDVDTLFGAGWKTVADELQRQRCIEMEIVAGEVFLKLRLRTSKRREYMKKYRRASR